MQCNNIGQEYRDYGDVKIVPGDPVSFLDKLTRRRRYGKVVQVMPDFHIRVRVNATTVIAVPDKDITKED